MRSGTKGRQEDDKRFMFTNRPMCPSHVLSHAPFPPYLQATCSLLKELGDPNAQSAACVVS